MPVLMDLFSMPKISVGNKINFKQEKAKITEINFQNCVFLRLFFSQKRQVTEK